MVSVVLGAVAVVAACSSGETTVVVVDGGTSCGDGSQLCGSTCTVVARDAENCGACGKKCAAGEVCSQGACALSCNGGTTKCGTACADTKSDGANCGACGTKCASGEVCSAGKCATTCGAGTTQCGQSCVNTQTDQVNCGACGTLCGAGEQCVGGKCTLSCQTGLTLCSAPQVDGGVSDAASDAVADVVVSDAANDGASSDASSDAASDASSDAGPVLGVPYCANLKSDDANCGGCGVKCGPSQQCVNGACATTCAAPNTLCPTDGGAPVCANLKSDVNNCGTCGKVCSGSTNVCVNGICSSTTLLACTADKDVSGSNYVICAMNSTGAWITANNNGGGCTYGALNICKKYGFTKVNRWGGTCGTICGYCNSATCSAPQGQFTLGGNYTTYDSGGGNPVNGGNISCTVQWECAP
jgi:hypothetical protein